MTTTATGSSRTTGWTAAVAQIGFTLVYAVSTAAALSHAADVTGRWAVPAYDDTLDTSWGWGFLIGTILQLAPILTGLGLLITAMLFLLGHPRGDRALTVTLLAATAATVLTLTVSLTPAAQSLATWLLD